MGTSDEAAGLATLRRRGGMAVILHFGVGAAGARAESGSAAGDSTAVTQRPNGYPATATRVWAPVSRCGYQKTSRGAASFQPKRPPI